MNPLTLALPKGRLQEQMLMLLDHSGIGISFDERKLTAGDKEGRVSAFLVKNSDLPTYVNHGIAGLGVCGDDVLLESKAKLLRLKKLPFGATRMCLAGLPETGGRGTKPREPRGTEPRGTEPRGSEEPRRSEERAGRMEVATKFPNFTRAYFHSRGIPVEMIKLNGSVELAPLLGLAPYIVDLVETGTTLKANGLVVLEELRLIEVYLVANPAYYKIHFRRIHEFTESLGMR